jgi:hypothetical protein
MDKQEIKERFQRITGHLDEKARRLWCANEAIGIGFGGVSLVSLATGVSRTTITVGTKEIKGEKDLPQNSIRRVGGGRKQKTEKDKDLKQNIEDLVSPQTLGDPESPLRWSSKSTRKIASELNSGCTRVSHALVSRILSGLGYSLQANRKTNEGTRNNPDRNMQFEFINEKTKEFQKREQPILSVDTKKKENIGNFKNNGQEYYKKGKPEEVNVYDFIDDEKGKVSPYGVYDLTKNKGWVSVGISADTAAFAVNSIRTWWYRMGKQEYQHTKEILITADCGGSNGYRVRLWKTELQKLATELQMTIHVSHFPPGTSKWNKIEHKLFCFISKNWRGRPLINRATVVNLIGNTTTQTGLAVQAKLDENKYDKGIKVSDKELALVKLERDDFHGEWNYKIYP